MDSTSGHEATLIETVLSEPLSILQTASITEEAEENMESHCLTKIEPELSKCDTGSWKGKSPTLTNSGGSLKGKLSSYTSSDPAFPLSS